MPCFLHCILLSWLLILCWIAKHLALKASAELGLAGTIHQSVQCGNPRVAELLTWQLGGPQIMLQGMKGEAAWPLGTQPQGSLLLYSMG